MYNTGNMISLLCLPRTAYFSYYQLGVYMKHRDFLEARTQTLNEIISYLVLSYANTFQKIIDVKAVKNAASFTRTGSPTAAARKRLSAKKEIKICFQRSHKKKNRARDSTSATSSVFFKKTSTRWCWRLSWSPSFYPQADWQWNQADTFPTCRWSLDLPLQFERQV